MNTNKIDQAFGDVLHACDSAHLVAWDTCHKIYLAMDEAQAEWFKNNPGYEVVGGTTSEMFDTVLRWFYQSCGLRFVQSVKTVDGDPNEGFVSLVDQFIEEDK